MDGDAIEDAGSVLTTADPRRQLAGLHTAMVGEMVPWRWSVTTIGKARDA